MRKLKSSSAPRELNAVKPARTAAQLKADVEAAVAALKRKSSKKVRDGLVRFGLPTANALGVQMRDIQALGEKLGPDHELAEALWETGVYEARLLVAYIGEPARLTPAQMDRWCRDFDNWGIADTLCFALFNESPHAWGRVGHWVRRKAEFEKRAGFALIACLSHPRRPGDDALFIESLAHIERGASDERNFVKKGVSWALRMVGRRDVALNTASVALARRLIESEHTSARWIGRDALKELTSAALLRRLAAG
ncbi:MAG TPA: DNA alkylation repair protein [Opitutaceae bacterium]|nr:DNA alkylation repair protein [Opitutaceae bacterium]